MILVIVGWLKNNMKLSKLIRELSVARDKIKADPDVEVYTHLENKEEIVRLIYVGEIKSVSYMNTPDNIRLICD